MALLEESLRHDAGVLRKRESFFYPGLKMREEVLPASCSEDGGETPVGWLAAFFGEVWRGIGGVLAFVTFMAIALGYALFLFPMIRALPGSTEVKARRVRKIIGRSFAGFLRSCTALGLIRPLRVSGLENLDCSKPVIIVANHPTVFDIVVLGSVIPNFNCVVKHKLTSNIFLRGGVHAAGYVTNDRPEEIIQRCVEGFERSQPLIIFPEGTRSPKDGLGTFSRGAAHLALRTGMPVITAILECNPPAFRKGQKWYSVPKQAIEYSVRFEKFSSSDAVASANCLSMRARLMTAELEAVFRDRTGVQTESTTALFKPAVLIPNHNHKETIEALLNGLAVHQIDCVIVDDGSGSETQRVLELAANNRSWVRLVRRPQRGGKGAAVMDGLRVLAKAGYTHAVQMDADGQHDINDLAKFLRESRARPEALILGTPKYGPEVPRVRLLGRQLSRVLVWLETFSFAISDPLLGFRVYPLQETVSVLDSVRLGERMDFDPEIAVRLKWRGVPIKNIPTRVIYPPGGLSNFAFVRDNVLMVYLHLRLWADLLRQPFRHTSRGNG
jgi:1-acyl-sn-glycerol-3-phosphate acyltransferase